MKHNWDFLGDDERYAYHGPDEMGDPFYISGWKCLSCGLFVETEGELPIEDGCSKDLSQPTKEA